MSVNTARAERIVANVGAALLNEVEDFLSRFIAYPSMAALVAHVLWIVHTHRMDLWESTPRLAALSPEPGSGKSRLLEVTEPLVPLPVHAVNTTPAYLFRKVSDEAGLPTILYDEIDTVFGPRAKENEDIRGMLNAGHRKGAVAGRCVVRGKVVETEELPAYCAVALAGLHDLPDTLMSRAVVIHMRRRSPSEVVEPWRYRIHSAEGFAIRDALSAWAATISLDDWPEMPNGIEDRNADVWEALLAVADAAGGDWPHRARVSAVTLVTDTKAAIPSLGVRLLGDLRKVFDHLDSDEPYISEYLFTGDIIASLVEMDEAPWADLRGKPIDARNLARRLAVYDIKPRTVRVGNTTSKGYSRDDLVDPWSRYVTFIDDELIDSSKRISTDAIEIKDQSIGASHKGSVTTVTTSQSDDAPPIDDEYIDQMMADHLGSDK